MSTSRHPRSRLVLRTGRLARTAIVGLIVVAVSLAACVARSMAGDSARSDERAAAAAVELDAARARAAQARALAEKSKRELDRYVARHFDEQEKRADEPVFVPDFPKSLSESEALPPPAIEADWLLGQIHRLKLERAALLSRFTPAHPQVIEIDVRLKDLRRQLTEAKDGRDDDSEPPDDDSESKVKQELTERFSAEKERERESAMQYRKALARWQKAERQARAAADAESMAAEKLAAAEAARKAALAAEAPPQDTSVPPVVEAAQEYRPTVREPAPEEPPPSIERDDMPAERAPAVPWPMRTEETQAKPRVQLEPARREPQRPEPAPEQPARPAPTTKIEMPDVVEPPLPATAPPSTAKSTFPKMPSGAKITVTNPNPEREQPPATYYPAETAESSPSPSDESAVADEVEPKPRREPPREELWIEPAAEPDQAAAIEPPGQRLMVQRRTNRDLAARDRAPVRPPAEPAVRRAAPAADIHEGSERRPIEPQMPVWSEEPLFESDLVNEALLDEPFSLEHQTPPIADSEPIFEPTNEQPPVPSEDATQDAAGDDADRRGGSWQQHSRDSGGGSGGRAILDRGRTSEWDAVTGNSSLSRPRDAAPPVPGDTQSGNVAAGKPRSVSQPIALAAIVAAIVVAGVASIWLARASRDRAFPTPESVKTELALPLVGVVPAARSRARRSPRRTSRAVILLGQVVLAIAVFAVVAYAISAPGLVERVCAESVATIDRAWTAARLR